MKLSLCIPHMRSQPFVKHSSDYYCEHQAHLNLQCLSLRGTGGADLRPAFKGTFNACHLYL